MINYTEILSRRFREAEWSMVEEDFENIVWRSDDIEKPSLSELDALWPDVKSEIAFDALRRERDRLLVASDWTQMPDAPVDQAAWAEYRQALRDLPENTVDPENPVWPTPPA